MNTFLGMSSTLSLSLLEEYLIKQLGQSLEMQSSLLSSVRKSLATRSEFHHSIDCTTLLTSCSNIRWNCPGLWGVGRGGWGDGCNEEKASKMARKMKWSYSFGAFSWAGQKCVCVHGKRKVWDGFGCFLLLELFFLVIVVSGCILMV